MVEPARATSPQPSAASAKTPAAPRARFLGLTRLQVAVFATLVVLANVPLIHFALRCAAPVDAAIPFVDDFNRGEIGPHYRAGGSLPRIVGGLLQAPGLHNNPLWLKAALPHDVRVEFDCRSDSPEGDIKAEIFGDGYSHSSGYVLVMGGWSNSVSIISRLDEHAPSLVSLRERERRGEARIGPSTAFRVETKELLPVQKGRVYRWRIERQGKDLRWYVDNQLYLSMTDDFPLAGPGHDRFGMSSWDAVVWFDNLAITPL